MRFRVFGGGVFCCVVLYVFLCFTCIVVFCMCLYVIVVVVAVVVVCVCVCVYVCVTVCVCVFACLLYRVDIVFFMWFGLFFLEILKCL